MNVCRRNVFNAVVALIAALVSGCATAAPPGASPGVERISYRYQAPYMCGGQCEVTNFMMTSEGVLWVEASERSRRPVRRTLQLKHSVLVALKEEITAYKPPHDLLNPQEGCKRYLTDQDGAMIQWWNGFETRVRVVDFGCQDDPKMNETLRSMAARLRAMSRVR